MNGFILANAVAGALSSIATRTGAAAALIGAIQYGSGMVGSALERDEAWRSRFGIPVCGLI